MAGPGGQKLPQPVLNGRGRGGSCGDLPGGSPGPERSRVTGRHTHTQTRENTHIHLHSRVHTQAPFSRPLGPSPLGECERASTSPAKEGSGYRTQRGSEPRGWCFWHLKCTHPESTRARAHAHADTHSQRGPDPRPAPHLPLLQATPPPGTWGR